MEREEEENTLYGLFVQAAEKYPDWPAVIEDERTLTFAQLLRMTEQIAETFPENVRRIGIVKRHRAEMIASILAVLGCGAVYVPAEPDFPTGRIREMMTEADVDFIMTEPSFLYKLKGFATRTGYEKEEIPSAGRPADAKEAAQTVCKDAPSGPKLGSFGGERKCRPDPEAPAYILYTSGTTGRPKGVCVTNKNVCHYVRAFAEEFHPKAGDVMLQYSVCSFDIFVEEVFASLLSGAALAIPGEEDKQNTEALMAFAARHGVTIISGFPYLLAEMNHLPQIPGSLRLLISGGDVLRGIYIDRLLPQVTVYNTYGPSETTVCAAYFRCNDASVLPDGTYPIGKPIRGTQIRLLDEAGREVPDGESGEICILGGGVSLGYIGDHEKENEAFVTQPDGSTLYHSGDLGRRLPDGNLAFLHRLDDQIMIYGKRVETAEVQSRLYRCKNVRQAVVRALVDEKGLSYMVAYVVSNDDAPLCISQIQEELSVHLAPFMIPEIFVQMPQIPLTPNGKVDMSKLPVVRRGDRSQMLQIRQAGIRDLDLLLQWRMEVLREVFAEQSEKFPPDLKEANRAYYVRALPAGEHIACFALVNGETVGCGGLCLQEEMPSPDNPSGKCAYIMNVYCRPACRHNGVGTTIVLWLIEQAKQRCIQKIYLETSPAGRAMYEEVGFSDMKDMMILSDRRS